MKRSFLAILIALMGAMMFGKGASAQVYSFNALNSTNGSGGGPAGFAVTITRAGNAWTINSVQALTGTMAPTPLTGSAGQVAMQFYDSPNGTAGIQTPATGGSFSGTAGVAGSGGTGAWGETSAASNGTNVDTFDFTAGGSPRLTKNGTNVFSTSTGAITLNDPNVKSFSFDVENGVQYTANINITPESGSALLLLSALVPVALVLRRSARSKSLSV